MMTCWAVATATAARMSSESVAAHQVSLTCYADLFPKDQSEHFVAVRLHLFVTYFPTARL